MASKRAAPRVRCGRDSNRAPVGGVARRAVLPGLAAVAVAGLLAACGSTGTAGNSGAGGTAGAAPGAAAPRTVVSARKLPAVGTVLVGRSGKTLYSPQQEADGKIRCAGGCLSFWFPVRVAAGAALRAPGGVTGVLGTIDRPDGLAQLTYNGKPLYTFRLTRLPARPAATTSPTTSAAPPSPGTP